MTTEKTLDSGLTSFAVKAAGMTSEEEEPKLDSSLRWNDEQKKRRWIPA
jgi:hypothetical protein